MNVKNLILATVLWSASAFAQGTFNPANRVAGIYDAPVTILDFTGGHANGRAYGPYWLGQWLAGPKDRPLLPVGRPLAFGVGSDAGYLVSATNDPTAGIVPGIPGGSPADIQLVAWDAWRGETWAEAETATGIWEWYGGIGRGNVVTIRLGEAGTPPANLAGLQGFDIRYFPLVSEPSQPALALLGSLLLVTYQTQKAKPRGR